MAYTESDLQGFFRTLNQVCSDMGIDSSMPTRPAGPRRIRRSESFYPDRDSKPSPYPTRRTSSRGTIRSSRNFGQVPSLPSDIDYVKRLELINERTVGTYYEQIKTFLLQVPIGRSFFRYLSYLVNYDSARAADILSQRITDCFKYYERHPEYVLGFEHSKLCSKHILVSFILHFVEFICLILFYKKSKSIFPYILGNSTLVSFLNDSSYVNAFPTFVWSLIGSRDYQNINKHFSVIYNCLLKNHPINYHLNQLILGKTYNQTSIYTLHYWFENRLGITLKLSLLECFGPDGDSFPYFKEIHTNMKQRHIAIMLFHLIENPPNELRKLVFSHLEARD